MNLLVALMAFATLMILLSTLVMMLVNGINATVRLRSRTLKRTMRLLYQDVIMPRLPPEAEKQSPEAFSREIIGNPALNPSNNVFQKTMIGPRKFDRLTAREFIEQFANTQAGRELAKGPPDRVREKLEVITYQFERYAEAGNNYYVRRAKLISVFVAVLLAFVLNIDAFRLFSGLIDNQQMSRAVYQSFDRAGASGDIDAVDLESSMSALVSLQGSGLAIGSTQFPFCRVSPLQEAVRADLTFEGAKQFGRDARCPEGAEPRSSTMGMVAPVISGFRSDIVGRIAPALSSDPVMAREQALAAEADRLVLLMWFISVLIAGGLIGLGAPFWASAYSQIAQLVPAMRVIAPMLKGGGAGARGGGAQGGPPIHQAGATPNERMRRSEDDQVRSREEMMSAFHASLPGDEGDLPVSRLRGEHPDKPSRRLV